jgi:hypothetical protein
MPHPAIMTKGPTYRITADIEATRGARQPTADVFPGVLKTSIVRDSGQVHSLAHSPYADLADCFLAQMPLT